jgi:hypothetical protein
MRVKIKKGELYKQVADDLNKRGIKPFSAKQWQPHNVQMAVSRNLNYPLMWESIHRISKQLYDATENK